MKRALLAVTAALAVFGGTAAAASAQNLHVFGGPRPWLPKAERQIAAQQSAVQRHWHTPGIRWTTHGWPVYIGTTAQIKKWIPCPMNSCVQAGYHSARVRFKGSKVVYHPYIVVNLSVGDGVLSSYPHFLEDTLDHEILETLVDPTTQRKINGNLAEICDPVQFNFYDPNPTRYDQYGGRLTDFVYPSYFRKGRGPYDYLHMQTTPVKGTVVPYLSDGRVRILP